MRGILRRACRGGGLLGGGLCGLRGERAPSPSLPPRSLFLPRGPALANSGCCSPPRQTGSQNRIAARQLNFWVTRRVLLGIGSSPLLHAVRQGGKEGGIGALCASSASSARPAAREDPSRDIFLPDLRDIRPLNPHIVPHRIKPKKKTERAGQSAGAARCSGICSQNGGTQGLPRQAFWPPAHVLCTLYNFFSLPLRFLRARACFVVFDACHNVTSTPTHTRTPTQIPRAVA